MLSSSCLHTNIGLDQKGLPGKNTLAYFTMATILVRLASIGLKVCLTQRHERNRVLERYSQHFIFSITYEWAQKARLSHYSRLERLGGDKHSSLFRPFRGKLSVASQTAEAVILIMCDPSRALSNLGP